ncbi:ECF transporter S component [Weissella cibaria]|uniref:ECF transporter S component n=1 Tax=Weissella cibaria TaxID=137591 RepID=UPI00164777F8|nr:ECF transporter S component [Weissella cibaria]
MKQQKGLSTRAVVATGIGAAVFLILFKFVAIPTGIPNTQINVAQSWDALVTAIFGPIVGASVAFIEYALNDAISYGFVWWIWVIAFALENGNATHDEILNKVKRWAEDLELQRLAMAGVLVDASPILLFDEPLVSLDSTSGHRVLALLD